MDGGFRILVLWSCDPSSMLPRTRFVESGGCSIGYQVLGEGPDLLFAPGLISHLDLQWSDPWFAGSLQRLASFSRLIIFDQRGIGLSDPVPEVPRLQQRVDDMRAVLDAAGSRQATLVGHCNGGPVCLLFAATHPERVTGMAICSSFAKGKPDDEHPGALPAESEQRARDATDRWGEGLSLRLFTESTAGGRWHQRMYGMFERAAASPGMARAAFTSTLEIDVTDVLPTIQAPTIVMHCRDDFMSIDAARYLAAHIAGAEFVEVAGPDHFPFAGTQSGEFLDVIEQLVTGRSNGGSSNVRLLSVLFTDIVGSTEHAARIGDKHWRELLDRHDSALREGIERFDGRLVGTAGDGALAAFDGPERAIDAALAVQQSLAELGLQIRAGVHTGPCELKGDDLVGMTIHVAARITALAAPGELLVSATVRKLAAGSPLLFTPHRETSLKGVPGRWQLYAAHAADEPASPPPTWVAEQTRGDDQARLGERVLTRIARAAPWLTRSAVRFVGGTDPPLPD